MDAFHPVRLPGPRQLRQRVLSALLIAALLPGAANAQEGSGFLSGIRDMVGKVMDEVSGSTGEQEAKTTAPPPMERTDTCVALTEMGLLPAQTEAEREAVRQAGGQHCLER